MHAAFGPKDFWPKVSMTAASRCRTVIFMTASCSPKVVDHSITNQNRLRLCVQINMRSIGISYALQCQKIFRHTLRRYWSSSVYEALSIWTYPTRTVRSCRILYQVQHGARVHAHNMLCSANDHRLRVRDRCRLSRSLPLGVRGE
jgi:hypothetical protein